MPPQRPFTAFAQTKTVLRRMVDGIIDNHLFIMAAGLSYYFIISLFPGLVFLAAIASYLRVSDVSSRSFVALSGFIPPGQMAIIVTVLHDAVMPNRNVLLSIGAVGIIWAASSAFDSLTTAIGIVYEAPDNRPFWITRPIAIAWTFSVGILFLIAFAVLTLGPHFGSWLAARLRLSYVVALIWPYVRWGVAAAFAVVSVEALYFIAPRKKQHFHATLPGAILAVAIWLAMTYFLGLYYHGHAPSGKMYGPLAASVAFMIWLYWAGFIVLVGAQLNAELEKLQRRKNLRTNLVSLHRPRPRYRWAGGPPPADTIKPSAEAALQPGAGPDVKPRETAGRDS